MRALLLVIFLAACGPNSDALSNARQFVDDGIGAVTTGSEVSSSAPSGGAVSETAASAASGLLASASRQDCLAKARGDAFAEPVPAPGGVTPAAGEPAREAMTRFFRQQRIDARSMTASANIAAILAAEERYRAQHGSYVLFEQGGSAHWGELDIALPLPAYHDYGARLDDGALLVTAEGNLDTDPFLDRWWGGPANDSGPVQLTADALDADMYPGTHEAE